MDAISIQAVAAALAAAATVAGVFFAARQDARAARGELQKSIENFMTPRLDAMDAHIRHLDDKLEGVSREVGRLDEKVGELGRDVAILGKDVAFLRGRQEARDQASS